MTTHHTAQGLASLGRHGDSMLVHMSPHEVAGLNYLAKKQGTKLTINPETGLPEAFSLGGLFSSLLPTFVGMAFPGAGMMPLLAGAATGAGLAAAKGDNPLLGGIMGGLGGYSGAGLGQALSGAANPAITGQALQGTMPQIGGQGASEAIGSNVLQGQAPGFGGLGFGTTTPVEAQAMNTSNLLNQSAFTNSGLSGAGNVIDPALNRFSQVGAGLKNIATGEPGAWDAFKAAGGSGMKLAMPLGGAVLGGLEPSDLYGEPIKPSNKGKYDPYATLNLNYDTGLRLYAGGGSVGNPSVGAGISNLYSSPDGTSAQNTPRDDYGIGRLSNLAAQQSLENAKVLGYADGGEVDTDTPELPSIDRNMGLASLTPTIPTQQTTPTQNATTALANTSTPNDGLIAKVASDIKINPNYQPTNPIEAAIAKQIKGNTVGQGQGISGLSTPTSQPVAPSYNASQAIAPTYYAGMNAPKGFAHGGYLNGQGDGMSDSIPATIEGKQPARLADGEFVVPADVVSHLGNGSSKAGSQRLYSMLDKVRKARTGHAKQGKQINPNKYLPA